MYLSSKFSPDIIALQETWLSGHQSFHLNSYRSFRLDRPSKGGGLAFFIKHGLSIKAKISYKHMCPDSEIFALDVTLPGCPPFSLVNVYFPTGVQTTRSLDLALPSWCKDKIVVGDFNSHNTCWGFKTDQCGKRLWEWTNDNNLRCLNSRTPTFIRDRFRSALDLSFISSSISSSAWSALDCATNSDHFPIMFDITCPVKIEGIQVRVFVNYTKFKNDLKSALTSDYDDEDNKAMYSGSPKTSGSMEEAYV